MEFGNTRTIDRKPDLANVEFQLAVDETAGKRLEILLNANAETARRKRAYPSQQEKFESELIKRPLNAEKAFSYFGLMLGIFPPATLFTRFVIESRMLSDGAWFIGILLIVNVVSAVVGFFSGKWIARLVASVEKLTWIEMILLLPFIGFLWGMMAGGAGGFIIFFVGAVFGGAIGGMVGAAALPFFVIFHRLLKRGDLMEVKHFLPIALAITLSICSFILGR
ncbi:MAG: hypothetical protein ACREO5_07880 [Candidatus Binatia bacterium]